MLQCHPAQGMPFRAVLATRVATKAFGVRVSRNLSRDCLSEERRPVTLKLIRRIRMLLGIALSFYNISSF